MLPHDNSDLQTAEDWKYILLVLGLIGAVLAVAYGFISLLLSL